MGRGAEARRRSRAPALPIVRQYGKGGVLGVGGQRGHGRQGRGKRLVQTRAGVRLREGTYGYCGAL